MKVQIWLDILRNQTAAKAKSHKEVKKKKNLVGGVGRRG